MLSTSIHLTKCLQFGKRNGLSAANICYSGFTLTYTTKAETKIFKTVQKFVKENVQNSKILRKFSKLVELFEQEVLNIKQPGSF